MPIAQPSPPTSSFLRTLCLQPVEVAALQALTATTGDHLLAMPRLAAVL